MSFLHALSDEQSKSLKLDLDAFVVQHAEMHRPIALVSSGGTAVDLEVHAVRMLENFSTGLRGAISVEGFLRRGYAVIHLWRTGSASPFARVLSQELNVAPHSPFDVASLGKLLGLGQRNPQNQEDDEEDAAYMEFLQQQDAHMAANDLGGGLSSMMNGSHSNKENHLAFDDVEAGIGLHRRIQDSPLLQKTMKERDLALTENRLLTVPFRTVEDYLAKLQLCAEAVQCCHSLALTYLAAAVSDFYIPQSERAEHKIQSREHDGLVLHMKPVPKTIHHLRTLWAPTAFCVSFKLETDRTILREKAEKAVSTYGVHMVVGNILETRHKQVWILAPPDQRVKTPRNAEGWDFDSISKSSSTDELDDLILDKVVENHFEFISWHFHTDGAGLEAAKRAHQSLKAKKKQVESQLFWRKLQAIGTELTGALLSIILSYSIVAAIRKSLRFSR